MSVVCLFVLLQHTILGKSIRLKILFLSLKTLFAFPWVCKQWACAEAGQRDEYCSCHTVHLSSMTRTYVLALCCVYIHWLEIFQI